MNNPTTANQSTGDGDRPSVLISQIGHYLYCPRQCALIAVEQVFTENTLTQRGRRFHREADVAAVQMRDGQHIVKALPLFSDNLGLVGKADIVEFHGNTPYPVEYKHGRKKRYENLDAQLCAQALCLEEMFGEPVPWGAIYHISSHKRREVEINETLRRLTLETIKNVRTLLANPQMPPPLNNTRCRMCSLKEDCLPSALIDPGNTERVKDQLFNPEDEIQ